MSAAAASLAALSFVLMPLARPAGAEGEVPIYESHGIGQGVVVTFANKPSIFDPLVQLGADYVEVAFSSQGGGQGQSISSPVFPGKFAMGALTGAVGCGGLKGWVEARWPATEKPTCESDSQDSFFQTGGSGIGKSLGVPQLDTLLNENVKAGIGLMRASARADAGSAIVTTGGAGIYGDPTAPVLEVGEMIVQSSGARAGDVVEHTVRVTAKDVGLVGDVVRIGAIVTTVRTTSDGVSSTADGSVIFTDVSAMVNGQRHRAAIEDDGIHITDPKLDHDQRIGLTEDLRDALLAGGLSIRATTPETLQEGARAEALVGGLILEFTARVPTVVIPDALAPVYGDVIAAIPTKCVVELTHKDIPDLTGQQPPSQAPRIPLCFGAGVLPGSGSQPAFSLNVASASALTVAGLAAAYPGPVPSDGIDPPYVPPFEPGGPIGPVDGGGFPPPPDGGPPPTQPPFYGGPTTGLVARLPAAALAWAGAGFLVLAVGLAAAPSLRHARP